MKTSKILMKLGLGRYTLQAAFFMVLAMLVLNVFWSPSGWLRVAALMCWAYILGQASERAASSGKLR